MAGSTPLVTWPYPSPGDKLAEGASMIEQLARAVEAQFFLDTNKFAADAPYTSYPMGVSVMAVSNTIGWPYGGIVISTRRLGGSFVKQEFVSQSASANIQATRIRYGYTSGTDLVWSAWKITSGANAQPAAMASGRVSLQAPTGGGTVSTSVSFPAGRFLTGDIWGPIRCSVTAVTSVPSGVNASFSAATPSGMSIYLYRGDSVSTGIDWVATQGLEPAGS